MEQRRPTTQPISWFNDLRRRELLDLDPPYQRRSVWNQAYKDYFVETLLLEYPTPPIFLHEEIDAEGNATYSVVDGKQRLTAVFEFVDDEFPIGDKSVLARFQGRSFSSLDEGTRKGFWRYQFTVEYLQTTDEQTLDNIFDRINRNVARLTPQELRHAKYSGEFATTAEELAELMAGELPPGFPRIAASSRRQMKDVEFISQILLLLEAGPQSFSQDELDAAYSDRDVEWEARIRVEKSFRELLNYLGEIIGDGDAQLAATTRLRNQADFYSLVGAIHELSSEGSRPSAADAAARLRDFVEVVEDESRREQADWARRYYEAARSASNDLAQRRTRIDTVRGVLRGELL